MRALVVYDSIFGNTEKIARAIASVLGERGAVDLAKVGQGETVDWSGFELVVVGGPIHRVSLSAAMKATVKEMPRKALSGAGVAVFETCYRNPRWQRGAAARKLARRTRKHGGRLIVPAESFFVVAREGPLEEGEEERARRWAQAILGEVSTSG